MWHLCLFLCPSTKNTNSQREMSEIFKLNFTFDKLSVVVNCVQS